ncbi:MAG TPA: hypothetical protein VIM12_13175 [Noviherbaspirillum sp.]|jgi:hypothetical protein|uniref:hypothetical protein n=1 Tax=Noviherbaspirillum sp. TaxID=1926288 RepID=UPI002F94EBB9
MFRNLTGSPVPNYDLRTASPTAEPGSPLAMATSSNSHKRKAEDQGAAKPPPARRPRFMLAGRQVRSAAPGPVLLEAATVPDAIEKMRADLLAYEAQSKVSRCMAPEQKAQCEERIFQTRETLDELAEAYADRGEHRDRQIFKTAEGGTIKGLLSVEIAPAHEGGPDAFWLNYIVAAPGSRGHGRALVLAAVNCSERANFDGKLHVISSYEASHAFYWHLGFEGSPDPISLDPGKHPEIYRKVEGQWVYARTDGHACDG